MCACVCLHLIQNNRLISHLSGFGHFGLMGLLDSISIYTEPSLSERGKRNI